MATVDITSTITAAGLGRLLPPTGGRARADGLRKFPGFGNWVADPFGFAALGLEPSDSTGWSPNTVSGGDLGGPAKYVRAFDQVALMLAADYGDRIRVELDVCDWANYAVGQTPGDPTIPTFQATRVLSQGVGLPWAQMPASSGQMLSHALTGRTQLTGKRYFFSAKVDPDPSVGWAPGSSPRNLFALSAAGGQYVVWLQLAVDGTLLFRHSPDGTTLIPRTSTASVTAAVGTPTFVGVDANLSDAGGQTFTFWASTDEGTPRNWTQIGAAVTASGTSSFFVPTSTAGWQWTLGSVGLGNAANNWLGRIYEVRICKGGRFGPTILPVWPGSWHWGGQGVNTAFYPIQGGPLLRVVNGARPGWGLDEFDSPVLLPLLVPHLPYLALVANSGHNDMTYFASDLIAKWDRLFDRIAPRAGDACDLGLMLQNPTVRADGPPQNPLAQRNGHKTRMAQLAAYGQRRGISVIDTYSVFGDYVIGCASKARPPVAAKPSDNSTPGDGTLSDLLHVAGDPTGQAGVHPKDPVVGDTRLQGGAWLQARKIYEELVA